MITSISRFAPPRTRHSGSVIQRLLSAVRRPALIAALTLGGWSAVFAQSSNAPASTMFVAANAGGQVQTRTFSDSSTFTDFNASGTVAANQTLGRGGVVDISGGRRFGPHLAVAVGVSATRVSGDAAVTATIPDPLFVGRSSAVTTSISDLKQTDVGVNLQLLWTTMVSNKVAFTVFLGPSFIRVSQDVGTVTVATNSQNVTPATVSQSASTAKAGTLGFDLSSWLSERYGAGVFVRYAGGQVDLPSVSKLKVGGVQVGGGIRVRF